MRETALISVFVPVALMILMLGLGLSLEVRDLVRVARAPRSLALGLFAQLLLLPILGLGVALGSGLATPLALGFVILALCPGGALSNVICHFLRADLPLSVSLTALSSLITPFSIPVLYSWAARLFRVGDSVLALPIAPTMGRLVAVSILPIVLGMLLRRRLGERIRRVEAPIRVLSVVLFVAVIAGIVMQNSEALRQGLASLGTTALVLNLSAMGMGVGLARAARLPFREMITIGTEVGMQNAATATFVTATLLGDSTMALPAAVYALIMLPSAFLLGMTTWARTPPVGDEGAAQL